MCCSVLQCVAGCCRVLQGVIVFQSDVCRQCVVVFQSDVCMRRLGETLNLPQCVAVCCSVLQCVAVRCSALQCVAVL